MSTSDAVMPLTFLKKLYSICYATFFLSFLAINTFSRFDVRTQTASLVSFILRAAHHQLVCRPVGNTIAIPSNILPTSMGIVPPVTRRCEAEATSVKRKLWHYLFV
ncbi:hypothetical protein EDD85DRAFT_951794 [Armillaria nabsnona]|nr:hypothetical protein EDD85DRAFT_951794 [Armillaria nabsnona]